MTKRQSKSDTEAFYKKLVSATNAANQLHFNESQSSEYEVSIKPDSTVGLGKFKPDPSAKAAYRAHPTTIAAMRKDLFIAGSDEFLDLQKVYQCESCKADIDIQFWIFCPYCEAKFPTHWEIS